MFAKDVYHYHYSYGIEDDYLWFRREIYTTKGSRVELSEVFIYRDGTFKRTTLRIRTVKKYKKNRFSKEYIDKLENIIKAFLEGEIRDHVKIPILDSLFQHSFSPAWIDTAYRLTIPFIPRLEIASLT